MPRHNVSETDLRERLIYIHWAKCIARSDLPLYFDEVPLVVFSRNKIANAGMETDAVKRADTLIVQRLYELLGDCLLSSESLADNCMDYGASPEDLKNWWFHLDEIAMGKYPISELPDYLRESASRYQKNPLTKDEVCRIAKERWNARPSYDWRKHQVNFRKRLEHLIRKYGLSDSDAQTIRERTDTLGLRPNLRLYYFLRNDGYAYADSTGGNDEDLIAHDAGQIPVRAEDSGEQVLGITTYLNNEFLKNFEEESKQLRKQ